MTAPQNPTPPRTGTPAANPQTGHQPPAASRQQMQPVGFSASDPTLPREIVDQVERQIRENERIVAAIQARSEAANKEVLRLAAARRANETAFMATQSVLTGMQGDAAVHQAQLNAFLGIAPAQQQAPGLPPAPAAQGQVINPDGSLVAPASAQGLPPAMPMPGAPAPYTNPLGAPAPLPTAPRPPAQAATAQQPPVPPAQPTTYTSLNSGKKRIVVLAPFVLIGILVVVFTWLAVSYHAPTPLFWLGIISAVVVGWVLGDNFIRPKLQKRFSRSTQTPASAAP